MKIIIAGAGEVGSHVAKLLCNANHDVTVLDSEIERLQILESHLDILTLYGHVTSIDDLTNAKVQDCDLFISVPPFESLSILSAILAKKLGAKMAVARINTKEYLQPENKAFFKKLGIDEMFYPEELATEEIVESLKRIGIRQCIEFAEGELLVFGVKLGDNAPIIGKKLKEGISNEDKDQIGVVALIRNNRTIIPNKNDRFEKNDRVYFITTKAGVDHVTKKTGKRPFEVKNIMIVGGSRIGRKVALELENDYHVKLIEIREERAEELADRLSNTLVIRGDGRSAELMQEEGIENIDAFIALTGNSEVNILACQLAKKLGVKKSVAEIENLDYLDFAESIGIGTVVNKKLLAAASIFRYTFKSHISTNKWLTNTDAEMIELFAEENSPITKKKISSINLPNDVNIGGIIRGKEAFIATEETQIQSGDRVIVFVHHKQIDTVEKLFI